MHWEISLCTAVSARCIDRLVLEVWRFDTRSIKFPSGFPTTSCDSHPIITPKRLVYPIHLPSSPLFYFFSGHSAPALAISSTNFATESGPRISVLNLSCCNSSRFFSVGPGYVRYLRYGGLAKYCRYFR
jgi:hypothetical protein